MKLATKIAQSHHGPAFETQLEPNIVLRVVPNYLHREYYDAKPGVARVAGESFRFSLMREPLRTKVCLSSTCEYTRLDIHRDTLWRLRREIGQVLAGFMLPSLPVRDLLLWTADKLIKTAMPLSQPTEDLREPFFVNSQAKFDDIIADYSAGRRVYDLDPYSKEGASQPDYSHIEHFGWIYYLQIRKLLSLCRQHADPARPVVVVDLGTGGGNFILSAIRQLQASGVCTPVDFIGIDKTRDDMGYGEKMCRSMLALDSNMVVRFRVDDVTLPDFNDRLYALQPDMVVVNHLLEHLPGFGKDDPQLEDCYLHHWLLAARHSMGISVCFESGLEETVCAHQRSFNVERLMQLGHNLESRCAPAIVARDMNATALGGVLDFEKLQTSVKRGA